MPPMTPNNFQDSPKQTLEYYNQAQKLLLENKIPPTPANYTVAYEYAADRHPGLNREIDRQVERGGTMDSFFLANLFEHLIGDEVIRRVAITLKQYTSKESIAARCGGEEFIMVMPNTTIEQALDLAKSIHEAVAQINLIKRKTRERLPGVTISVGAASMKQGEEWDDLLERADQALYVAKSSGRNRVMSELQLSQLN